mmetsp:Transcript_29056/g.53367  ORF Transcript_29056/g.53367 Transcript_29056/m.53367 type:complete len:386 (+) Transcript_29056:65-1222(+)
MQLSWYMKIIKRGLACLILLTLNSVASRKMSINHAMTTLRVLGNAATVNSNESATGIHPPWYLLKAFDHWRNVTIHSCNLDQCNKHNTHCCYDHILQNVKVGHGCEATQDFKLGPEGCPSGFTCNDLSDGYPQSKEEILHKLRDRAESGNFQATWTETLERITEKTAIDNGMKSYDSALQKLDSFHGLPRLIDDFIRATVVFDTQDELLAAYANLQKELEIVEVMDRFKSPTYLGYQDMQVFVYLSHNGDSFISEVQLHNKVIRNVAVFQHWHYEIFRLMTQGWEDMLVERACIQSSAEIQKWARQAKDVMVEWSNELFEAAKIGSLQQGNVCEAAKGAFPALRAAWTELSGKTDVMKSFCNACWLDTYSSCLAAVTSPIWSCKH